MVIKHIFSREAKGKQKKQIWKGVRLPNRNSAKYAIKRSVIYYISAYCLFLHSIR